MRLLDIKQINEKYEYPGDAYIQKVADNLMFGAANDLPDEVRQTIASLGSQGINSVEAAKFIMSKFDDELHQAKKRT